MGWQEVVLVALCVIGFTTCVAAKDHYRTERMRIESRCQNER